MQVEHLCTMSHMSFTKTSCLWWLAFVAFLGGAFLSGCKRQVWDDNPDHVLRFSTYDADGKENDTLFFDTVFATVGSLTLPLKVYNDHEGTLLIDEIELEAGLASEFRVNVNGTPLADLSSPLRDIPLLPGDSMYVFIEVTINPDLSFGDQPFWVFENLRFLTNQNEQVVTLAARGQNAIFHGDPNQLVTAVCDETWGAELPHVIYGRMLVDEGCSLTIEPGTRVYGHSESGIWVRGGTLIAEGQLDNPIVLRGDRLDDNFRDSPGQWGLSFELTDTLADNLVNFSIFRGGIWLDRAVNCEMNHVVLSHATVGLWVDSVGTGAEYALNIRNSVVTMAESIGLLSQSGNIQGYNNLFSNCGQSCGYFALGGDIQMHLSTFANYGTFGSGLRQFPTLYINDWYESYDGAIQERPFAEGTEFRNCIAYGNNAGLTDFSEFFPDLFDATIYNTPLITHSAVHHQEENFPDWILDDATTVNQAPPFADTNAEDFTLTGMSPLWKGTASSDVFDPFDVSTDLLGMDRDLFEPTKGCYERLP